MNLLLRVAEEFPSKLHPHFAQIREAAKHPAVVSIASQVLTTAGKSNRVNKFQLLNIWSAAII